MEFQTVGGDLVCLFKCSCTMAKQQQACLNALPTILTAEAEGIVLHDNAEYCIHAYAIDTLCTDDESMIRNEENKENQDVLVIDFLTLEPSLVAVFDGDSYGLVGYKQTSKLQCLLCDHKCQHVRHFSEWCADNDVHLDKDEPLREEETYTSVSSRPIHYPLPTHLRSLHDQHERGCYEFPLDLVPAYSNAQKCKHGHLFDSADPVVKQWIARKGVIIHKEAVSITDDNRTLYYRPSLGPCDCRQDYDGQEELPFNFDGLHLFYYGYLFQYLHLMLEGKNPLTAFLRVSTHSFSPLSLTKPVQVKSLRHAWNAFARLLNINYAEVFHCPICGPLPSTVICDGTLLGFCKDLLNSFGTSNSPRSNNTHEPVHGSNHSGRVMLKSKKGRELLLKYSGYSRDRRCIRNPPRLSRSEYKQVTALLTKEGASPLVDFISRITSETQEYRAPQAYRAFLYELSLNTPVCGLLHVVGSDEVLRVIGYVATGTDIREVKYRRELKLMQDKAPLLASFLLSLPYSEPIPQDVTSLINHLYQLLLAPFESTLSTVFPHPPADSNLYFFPNLPMVRGTPNYFADHHRSNQAQEDIDACRKYASHHPTLTPGSYLYCLLPTWRVLWV